MGSLVQYMAGGGAVGGVTSAVHGWGGGYKYLCMYRMVKVAGSTCAITCREHKPHLFHHSVKDGILPAS